MASIYLSGLNADWAVFSNPQVGATIW